MENNTKNSQPNKTQKKQETTSLYIGKAIGFALGYLLISKIQVNKVGKKITNEDLDYNWGLMDFLKNTSNN